jgi:hypothetical protein
MKTAAEIWQVVHSLFEYHRLESDPDAQSALNRVASRELRLAVRQRFDSLNCSVRSEVLSSEALFHLDLAHGRSVPRRMEGPIVILQAGARRLVIEGNTRVNAWKAGRYEGPFSAIIIEPDRHAP